MKLIFALGNPGPDYAHARHNVGWRVLDALAGREGASFAAKPKFFAEIAECSLDGEKVLLAKPTTFYNETGRSLAAIRQFYKLADADILVVHDELALPLGTLRARVGGSDGGNNGIKSINAHGGEATARLRIGVANDLHARMDDADFVLGNFTKDEAEALHATIIPKSLELVQQFIAGEHQPTSHKLAGENTPNLL